MKLFFHSNNVIASIDPTLITMPARLKLLPFHNHDVFAFNHVSDSESVALLKEFTMDPEPIVSQSCEVALSMLEFERSGKSFEVKQLNQNLYFDALYYYYYLFPN